MIVAGLTGSIGMGKTTTANLFREAGISVFDADAAVHKLYSGDAALLVEAAFPGVVVDGTVDRTRLSERVLGNPDALKKLEAIIHPMVQREETKFLDKARKDGETLVILDHPLLFEMQRDGFVDVIIVVSTGAEEQRHRVLSRPGMTEEKLKAILDQQFPDAEKRKRADYVVDTGSGVEHARQQVIDIIAKIAAG